MASWILNSIEPTRDGTGLVKFDLTGISVDGTPLRHADVLIPGGELALAFDSGTNAQKAARVKELIRIHAQPDMQEPELTATDVANKVAAASAVALDGYLEEIDKTLPFVFAL